MWRVLTVVCVWVFVCVGVRLLGEWYNVFFSCRDVFGVYVFFLCRCVHQHPQSHTPNSISSISTNTHTRSPPHQCHVISCHVTCSAGSTHTPTHHHHHHTQHLIGRNVCDGFFSCVWKSLFLFHCLCLKVCVCVCPRVVVSRACMCLFVCLCGGECSVTNTPTLTLTHHHPHQHQHVYQNTNTTHTHSNTHTCRY